MNKKVYLFLNAKSIHESLLFSYAFSCSGTYKVPNDSSRSGSIEVITKFPINAHPEIFGMHENADIAKNIKETNNVSKKICKKISALLAHYLFLAY